VHNTISVLQRFICAIFIISNVFLAAEAAMIKVESSAFKANQSIPKKYTCDGADVSPPLTLRDVPKETKSIAIIVVDPDAPSGVFDHWIVWNIPGDKTELQEGVKLPHQGINHFREMRYRGPCPPKGKPHRYFFKVYALDTLLNLPDGSSKEQLEDALDQHILSQGELIGIYQR
jgi:Raf kinase inhibitor-like YbhB/YbcL family protein